MLVTFLTWFKITPWYHFLSHCAPSNIFQYYLLKSKTETKPSLSCLFKMKLHCFLCILQTLAGIYDKNISPKAPISYPNIYTTIHMHFWEVFALFRISYFYYYYLHQLFAVIFFLLSIKDTRIKLWWDEAI